MLLAGLVPPGYRHAHADGQVAHRHAGHGHDRTGGHHDQSPDHHPSHDVRLSAGAVAHDHLVFLYFDMALPASDGGGSDPNTDLANDSLYVVRLTGDCLPRADTARDTSIIDVSASEGALAEATCTLGKRGTRPRPNAVLLCDTARHERSGVQLF